MRIRRAMYTYTFPSCYFPGMVICMYCRGSVIYTGYSSARFHYPELGPCQVPWPACSYYLFWHCSRLVGSRLRWCPAERDKYIILPRSVWLYRAGVGGEHKYLPHVVFTRRPNPGNSAVSVNELKRNTSFVYVYICSPYIYLVGSLETVYIEQ